MPDSRMALEADRSQPLQQFLGVGDLRPGSITSTIRRCGKPICHCAKPNDPGHDPQLRLARGVSGKTVTESFPTPAACRMARQEVSEFHRFQVLSQELIALNEKICDGASGRAGAGGLDDPGKKTAAAIPQETAREIATLRARVFAERRKAGRTALAAMETALRDGLAPTGTGVLTGLLQGDIPPLEPRQLPCPCGCKCGLTWSYLPKPSSLSSAQCNGAVRTTCVHTAGKVSFRRTWNWTEKTSQSPGVRRMLAAVGHAAPSITDVGG